MGEYAPKIQVKIEELIKQIDVRANTSIDITQWTTHYAFDVMGIIAFSKVFNQLEDGAGHSAIMAIELIGVLGPVPWFAHLLVSVPGLFRIYERFIKYCEDQVEERKVVCSEP